MKTIIVKLMMNIAALFLVVKLVQGIRVDSFSTLLVAALVLSILNTFLRPVIKLIALPVTILTLGLFTFVINTAMFALSARLVNGFEISGVKSAFIAAFAFSIISFLLNIVMKPSE